MKQVDMQKTTRLAATLGLVAMVAATAWSPRVLRGQEPSGVISGQSRRPPVRVLEGRFTSDLELTRGITWVLRGEVFIASPARLVVPPGTRVIADSATGGTLIVERGAQVAVVGDGALDVPVVTDAELVLTGVAAEPATAAAADSIEQATTAAAAPPTGSPVRARAVVSGPSAPAPAVPTASGARVIARPAGAVRPGSVRVPGGATKALSQYTGTSPVPGARVAVRRALALASPGAGVTGATQTAEARDATLQTVGPPTTVPGLDNPVRVIHGRFTQDLHLTSDTYWVLRGAVFIGAPARIIIDPGTRIVGELATTGTLVIERGAQIIADGTAQDPIVFTSDQPVGLRGRGDWGGVVINGNAPINLPGGVGIGEGGTGVYGGNDPHDNSGILRYVRVEFAGIEFSPDNELNGIAFQGVGRGTIVDHVQVHFNKDDGLEWFGGTADAKHVVITAAGDDSLDWTHGWQGRLQFVVVQQRGDDADRGIEADNLANNNDLLPRSQPTIYNATFIGDPDTSEGTQSTQGVELREGTAGHLRNFIITGFKLHSFRVTGTSSAAQAAAGALTVRHGMVFGNGTDLHSSTNAAVAASGGTIDVADPQLVAPFDHASPNFRPAAGSPALTTGFETPPNDGFFDTTVTYRGALSDDPAADWTLGWTNYEQR